MGNAYLTVSDQDNEQLEDATKLAMYIAAEGHGVNRGAQRETTHRETSSASIGEGNAPVDVVEELVPGLT